MKVHWAEVDVPDPEDELLKPFWEGTRISKLRAQQCVACNKPLWPPRPMCNRCRSTAIEWMDVDPRGQLYSWVVVNKASGVQGFLEVPYIVGLIELQRDPPLRYIGNVVNTENTELEQGMIMTAIFVPVSENISLVYWQPALSNS